jgi:uncharacterized protein involved in outer membrane biogenesis/outer membrane protein OmpA-like peptidoglycan-associated protein
MSKGLQRGLAALVILPLLYALLGFLVLPWAALKLVNQQLAERVSQPASLERIEFNPFSLELTLHRLRLGAAGAEQLTFARLYADLQLDSLWRGELHLREVRLEQPHVELRFAADGSLNLQELFKTSPPAAEPPAADNRPFPLRVDHLQLSDGSLHFTDQRPPGGIEFRYARLDLELRNLASRGPDSAELRLAASGPDGAALDGAGRLGLAPLRAEGRLTIGDTPLAGWWPYLRASLPLHLQQGSARLSGDYRLELNDGLHLRLDNAHVQLDALKLQDAEGRPLLDLASLAADSQLELAPGTPLRLHGGRLQLSGLELHRPTPQPLLRVASLEANEAELDLAARQLSIGRLHSQGLEAWAAREADGRLDWQVLLEQQLAALQTAPATSPPADVTPPPAAPAGGNTPAGAPSSPGAAAVAPANPDNPASGTGPTPPPPEPTAPDGPLAIASAAQPASPPPPGPWQVLLKDVQLRGYRAHLEDRAVKPATPLEIGPLDIDLHDFASDPAQPFDLRLAGGLGPRGHLEASGQARLQPLSAQLKVLARDLDLRLAQAYLAPFVRLELRSGLLAGEVAVGLSGVAPLALQVGGHLQVSQLHTLDTLKNRDFVRWRTLDLDGLDYHHGQQLRIARVRLLQPYARFIVNENLSTNVKELLIPQPPAATPAAPGQPLHVVVGGVEIRDGSANFADFSLTPNFATAIQQLNGRIGSIDSQSRQPASVDVRGKVDRYAPVSIQGSLTPFSPLEQLDIATRFRRVELTTLTPYAGKFAGYKIRKGRLNLDLHYRIDQGRLNAENKVVLEHLQLGERVDSPSATDLPVRLAVALLKDADGNIDIALPVKGDLNNPEFSVMPIVWQTLRNLVLRAVQAPFKLIAGLLDGGEESLDSVPFAAGSSTLEAPAKGSLDKLARALQQRPALRLEIEGASLQALDGPLLAERRLAREYQNIWYRILQRRGDKVPADPGQLEVPKEQQANLLEGIYRARLKQQPPADWRELKKPARAARLRQAVLDSWAQNPLLLRQLAQDRARAIKAYLVEHGRLADERIYLLEVGSAETPDAQQRIAVPLHLDSE